jgi:hypothetical protein
MSIKGDKRSCNRCTLQPLCPYQRDGGRCQVPESEPKMGVWTKMFANGSVESLEDGLAAVLSMQAERVGAMIEEELPADASAADKLKRTIEIDKQLDKVFKNGLALRNAKMPRALPGPRGRKQIESEREDLPMNPTPQQVSEAMHELQELGYERENITPTDVRNHLIGQRAISAGSAEDRVF